MREIKFRAWFQNEMHDWEEIGKLLHVKYFDEWIAEGGVILMQYTGLKDKNGREIYEGDVVRWPMYNPKNSKIGTIQWNNEEAGFVIQNQWMLNIRFDRVEVIGNIYENPEFLK